MTKDELRIMFQKTRYAENGWSIFSDAVDRYSEALIAAKPFVTRSLPCLCENQKLGQLQCDNTCVDSGEFD